MRSKVILFTALSAILCPAQLYAQAVGSTRPAVFEKLVQCRTITDNAARLACFDEQSALLETAERNNDVMVVDRQQVKKAKRGLFGLSVPSLGGLFGKNDKDTPDAEELESLDATITKAWQLSNERWVIILDDGAKWVQAETKSIYDPKPGQKVEIKKAALGSFLAKINGQRAIRMRREN